MIYEVEFTSTSREAARTTAKQLINERVLASASITPCDYIGVNAEGEIEEQYLVKIKGLTTAVDYLLENFKLKNFVAKAASVDTDTAKKVAYWCNEEVDVPEMPTTTWAEYREQVLRTKTDNDALQELAQTGHPGLNLDQMVYQTECEDKSYIIEETTTPVDTVQNYETDEVEAVENADEDEKKHKKLPKWAEEEGLTYAEYKKRMNERTAARWGLTYQEYSKLAAEARKNDKPLKEYFEEQGLTYQEDIPELDDEFGDGTRQIEKDKELLEAEASFINWLKSVDLNEENTIDTVFDSWCNKHGLTQKQRAILRCSNDSKEYAKSVRVPQWATNLGLTPTQWSLFARMGTAANWGITLGLYDSFYNEAKLNGVPVETELAAKYTRQHNRGAAQHIAEEFRTMMNHITKLQELYSESN